MYAAKIRKRGFPFVLLAILTVCSTTFYCKASTPDHKSKSNKTFRCEHGHLDECLIASDMELELVMDSYITRILGGKSDSATSVAKVATETIVCKDGQSPSYFHCKCPIYRPKC
ncbi:conserved hypothetical protein [Ricinus communis]|uniref:Uncharacterized protein n=1 Tax=Ricinus communis TaxID=3988 RepID=B9SYC2_RICCO|nr:conserved hypothetical protein [Ricinus communis]